MSGGVQVLPHLVLPYSRLAMPVFAAGVLLGRAALIGKTRLGLLVRAITQNRRMASCVGVSTARIDTVALGLGVGTAGSAGCARSQVGNVGPESGQGYIVDSVMVVVLGGVGQLACTVYAALGLGLMNKLLEGWAGAVLAKITVLVVIVVLIQKRPQGLFAVKGRRAEAWWMSPPTGATSSLPPPGGVASGPAVPAPRRLLDAGTLVQRHGLLRGARSWTTVISTLATRTGLIPLLNRVVLVPGLLALVFGWFAVRSRIKGVHFSIITQALTCEAMLLFFRNETGVGGNNGFTDVKRIPGLPVATPSTCIMLFIITGATLVGIYLVARLIVNSKYGRVWQAIRDAGVRVVFTGYTGLAYKLSIWTLSAVLWAAAGALYVPQAGLINPGEMSPSAGVEIAIWAALGGRATAVGPIIGAFLSTVPRPDSLWLFRSAGCTFWVRWSLP